MATTGLGGDHDASPFVRAKARYLVSTTTTPANGDDGNTRAAYHASQAGDTKIRDHEREDLRVHEVEVRNARCCTQQWDLDIQGVKLVQNKTAVKDFYADDVQHLFYKEVKELLLQHIPGARRIEIFDHTFRASTAELRKQLVCREPSASVHNDYTANSARKRLLDVLPEEAKLLLSQGGRFAIVNLWRSATGTVESAPMTFCDSTTIDVEKDLIPIKRVAKDRVGEIQLAEYNPSHRWYYWPRLKPDEALLFKTFDSSDSGVNKFTLHTALEEVGDLSVPRQSIEVRAFVFF